jgi:hypothetical protein
LLAPYPVLSKNRGTPTSGYNGYSCASDHSLQFQQNSSSAGIQIYLGIFQIAEVVQMFVLGPRLILGVREYHAKLVANSDEGTEMTVIAFQEHIVMTTGSGV